MQKTIKIGSKEVEMQGNAATDYRFKQMFHADLMEAMYDAIEVLGKGGDLSAGQTAATKDSAEKLGFIMAKQAEGADMKALMEEDFFDWLADFETLDMYNAAPDIISLWLGQRETTSKSKKAPAPAHEK